MGLILDSSIFIAAERRGDSVQELIERLVSVTGNQDAALSSVGLTELVHGIYRAQTKEIRIRRQSFIDELIRDFIIFPYTTETALLAGKIGGEQMAQGVTIPFADLLIGATALELGFSVLTGNARHFQLIPGLTVLTL
jgi:predicted nucleic acid-binding protein